MASSLSIGDIHHFETMPGSILETWRSPSASNATSRGLRKPSEHMAISPSAAAL
jgi:hypothetical protein